MAGYGIAGQRLESEAPRGDLPRRGAEVQGPGPLDERQPTAHLPEGGQGLIEGLPRVGR